VQAVAAGAVAAGAVVAEEEAGVEQPFSRRFDSQPVSAYINDCRATDYGDKRSVE